MPIFVGDTTDGRTATTLAATGSTWFGNSADDLHNIQGTLYLTGAAHISAAAHFSEYIYHKDDSDTYIRFTDDDINIQVGGVDFIKITEDGSQDQIVFNDGGVDVDFIVESADETKALYLNAANNAFHVNHGETAFTTKIHHVDGLAMTVDSSGIIFNDDSQSSIDFRVESDGEDEAIFLDASSNTLYVNKGATSFTTVIKSTNEEAIRVGATGIIFNQYGHASNDFRVESDTNTHMLFVDSSTDRVGVGTGSPAARIHATGSFVLAAPPSGSHPAVSSMNNGEFTFFYESSTLKVSMKVDGAEMTGSVASIAAPAGSSLSAAGLYGESSYSSGGASGYSSGMNACSAAGSSSGTSQGWYRNSDGTQVYEDSAGSTAVSLSAGGYFWLANGGSKYRFYITTAGVVYTRPSASGGSTTNLDSTAGSVSC